MLPRRALDLITRMVLDLVPEYRDEERRNATSNGTEFGSGALFGKAVDCRLDGFDIENQPNSGHGGYGRGGRGRGRGGG